MAKLDRTGALGINGNSNLRSQLVRGQDDSNSVRILNRSFFWFPSFIAAYLSDFLFQKESY